MSHSQSGFDRPTGFTQISTGSDTSIVQDAEYGISADATPIDAQWMWHFDDSTPSPWLATALALRPVGAAHLAFTTQPSRTLPFMTISPAVRVAVTDDLGNTITGYNGPVTIAIGHNGGLLLPGTLSGTKTVTAVNGIATFADLSIDHLGNGYTLTVSGAGLTGAQSAPFNVSVL
jgi:hypothetical protein